MFCDDSPALYDFPRIRCILLENNLEPTLFTARRRVLADNRESSVSKKTLIALLQPLLALPERSRVDALGYEFQNSWDPQTKAQYSASRAALLALFDYLK